jgi:hypothetical protein
MTDALALSGMIQSLNALAQIGKSLVGIHDANAIREKAVELNREILSAQASALATQADQFALLKHIDDLQKQITDLEAWNTEKQKYHLVQLRPPTAPGGRAFAYSSKETSGDTADPIHLICPNCYEDARKSILQEVSRSVGRVNILSCHHCGLEINRTGVEYECPPIKDTPLRSSSKR